MGTLHTPQTYSDPTLQTLRDLEDTSKYMVVRNAPIFKAHTRSQPGKEGEPPQEIVVKDEDLPAIAAQINQREMEDGLPIVITIGHRQQSDPAYPEWKQPPVVGFAKNARVGPFGPSQKLGLLADLYIKREHLDEARKHPHRSVDFYPSSGKVSGVALLTRDAFLPLGAISYQAAHGIQGGRKGRNENARQGGAMPKKNQSKGPVPASPPSPSSSPGLVYRAPRSGVEIAGYKFAPGQHIPPNYVSVYQNGGGDGLVVEYATPTGYGFLAPKSMPRDVRLGTLATKASSIAAAKAKAAQSAIGAGDASGAMKAIQQGQHHNERSMKLGSQMSGDASYSVSVGTGGGPRGTSRPIAVSGEDLRDAANWFSRQPDLVVPATGLAVNGGVALADKLMNGVPFQEKPGHEVSYDSSAAKKMLISGLIGAGGGAIGGGLIGAAKKPEEGETRLKNAAKRAALGAAVMAPIAAAGEGIRGLHVKSEREILEELSRKRAIEWLVKAPGSAFAPLSAPPPAASPSAPPNPKGNLEFGGKLKDALNAIIKKHNEGQGGTTPPTTNSDESKPSQYLRTPGTPRNPPKGVPMVTTIAKGPGLGRSGRQATIHVDPATGLPVEGHTAIPGVKRRAESSVDAMRAVSVDPRTGAVLSPEAAMEAADRYRVRTIVHGARSDGSHGPITTMQNSTPGEQRHAKAPKGGIEIDGYYFSQGRHIPPCYVSKMTPEQRMATGAVTYGIGGTIARLGSRAIKSPTLRNAAVDAAGGAAVGGVTSAITGGDIEDIWTGAGRGAATGAILSPVMRRLHGGASSSPASSAAPAAPASPAATAAPTAGLPRSSVATDAFGSRHYPVVHPVHESSSVPVLFPDKWKASVSGDSVAVSGPGALQRKSVSAPTVKQTFIEGSVLGPSESVQGQSSEQPSSYQNQNERKFALEEPEMYGYFGRVAGKLGAGLGDTVDEAFTVNEKKPKGYAVTMKDTELSKRGKFPVKSYSATGYASFSGIGKTLASSGRRVLNTQAGREAVAGSLAGGVGGGLSSALTGGDFEDFVARAAEGAALGGATGVITGGVQDLGGAAYKKYKMMTDPQKRAALSRLRSIRASSEANRLRNASRPSVETPVSAAPSKSAIPVVDKDSLMFQSGGGEERRSDSGRLAGSIIGSIGGTIGGGAAGSLVAPVAGTMAGGAAGGIAGEHLGAKIGEKIGAGGAIGGALGTLTPIGPLGGYLGMKAGQRIERAMSGDKKPKNYSTSHVPTQYKAERAPIGGISIAGNRYVGGQFIPSEVMQRASDADKAKLAEAQKGEEASHVPASYKTTIDPALRDRVASFIQNAPKDVRRELTDHLNATMTGKIGDYINSATPEELHSLHEHLVERAASENEKPKKRMGPIRRILMTAAIVAAIAGARKLGYKAVDMATKSGPEPSGDAGDPPGSSGGDKGGPFEPIGPSGGDAGSDTGGGKGGLKMTKDTFRVEGGPKMLVPGHDDIESSGASSSPSSRGVPEGGPEGEGTRGYWTPKQQERQRERLFLAHPEPGYKVTPKFDLFDPQAKKQPPKPSGRSMVEDSGPKIPMADDSGWAEFVREKMEEQKADPVLSRAAQEDIGGRILSNRLSQANRPGGIDPETTITGHEPTQSQDPLSPIQYQSTKFVGGPTESTNKYQAAFASVFPLAGSDKKEATEKT